MKLLEYQILSDTTQGQLELKILNLFNRIDSNYQLHGDMVVAVQPFFDASTGLPIGTEIKYIQVVVLYGD